MKKSQKEGMKIRTGIAIAASMLVFLPVLLTGCGDQTEQPDNVMESTVSEENSGGEISASAVIDTNAWNLILVNFAHKIEESYTVQTKQIPGGQYVDARIYDSVIAMLQDCEAEGYHPGVTSAYRDVTWQTALFNQEVQEHLDAGKSKEEAVRLAKTEVAEPGTSEHHTGLALDLIADGNIALEEEFEDTDVGKWLAKNAYKYGFILRYPKGKESITGVIYEPWHFRYVGKEAAKEITERGICLEEYLGKIDTPA